MEEPFTANGEPALEVNKMKQEVEQLVVDPEEHWANIMEDDNAFQRKLDRGSGGGDLSSPDTKVFFVMQKILKNSVVHDYQDVIEFGVDGVLGMYGVSIDMNERERQSLREWLVRLGERVQTREMSRLAFNKVDSLLSDATRQCWSVGIGGRRCRLEIRRSRPAGVNPVRLKLSPADR